MSNWGGVNFLKENLSVFVEEQEGNIPEALK